MAFRQRYQPLLLPVDMREWLSEYDLAFLVLDAAAALNLGEFRRHVLSSLMNRADPPEGAD